MNLRVTLPLIAALALTACGNDEPAASPTSTPTSTLTEIERVVDECVGRTRDSNIYEADDGQTLIIDGIGEDDGASAAKLADHDEARACIFARLGMTDATLNRIGDTRALDGVQKDSWEGYEASWTYHPDNGLDMTIEAVE